MNNFKAAILLSIIFVLAVAGFYYYYLKQIKKSQSLSLPPFETPKVNFPSATASASPKTQTESTSIEVRDPGQVAGASNFPSQQPETGIGQTQAIDAGIIIKAPLTQAQITSPVTISGTANVPNNLIVEVKDASGQILGVRKTDACFGYQACPFTISVVFTSPETPTGQITVYSPPLSGNIPEYLQNINISF